MSCATPILPSGPLGHVPEMSGHVAEIAGHDPEKAGHVRPKYALATGKLVGEGFDHPALDTLILAMPISWKGTLQQYAGRLHREHATKTDVRITDIVDVGHPALQRMWEKRQRGYRAMGYRITDGA
jgi:superfamily II DNA or RNA helicase